MYSCPECDQPINQASDVCPYCGADQKLLAEAESSISGKATKKKSAKRIVLISAILLSILGAVGWFAVPWKMSGSKSEGEARARDAVTTTQQALNAYQAGERTFPPSLESLGDSVRKAAQTAQSARYTLQYAPGHPDPDGRISTYTLIARTGNFGFLNFYTDETGILRATREDRAATVADPPLQQK